MILLPNPPGTDKYLANSATPILMPSCPVVVVKSNFILNTCEIYTEGTDLNGFILNDCTINARCFEVCITKCEGNLCNQQQDNLSKCTCYQILNRSGKVIASVEVSVTTPDRNSFVTKIRRKWFLETYILSSPLQSGPRAASFEDFDVEDRFFEAINNVLGYMNRRCKF